MSKYTELIALFEQNADAAQAASMAAYMKNNFAFFGIPAPSRKQLTKELIKSEKKSKTVDFDLIRSLYADEHRECQYVADDLLTAMQKYLTFDDVPTLEQFARQKQWWDTIDFLDRVIGNIGLRDKRIDDVMLAWSTDADFWMRRIAIDHQNGRKEQTNADLMERIILNNLGSTEFFINKAIGWSLREYAKVNPDWVVDFIDRNIERLSRLSVREATKHMK